MKYPALGILSILLRSLAETVDKHNSGELDEREMGPVPSGPFTGEPTDDKPKRTRRTKEQIAADAAADEAAAEAKATTDAAQADMPPKKEEPPAPSGKSAEDLYQERRASFDSLVKGGHIEKVKEVLRKYTDSPNANRDLPAEHHEAFLKDIKALTESIAL